MAKQLQLSIPTPCHENWDNMTPADKGRFCDSCQKQVVDFSTMSDRQVAEFFKKPSKGSVCGRFMSDQLERDIEIPTKRIPWVKYFFQFALPAFLVSLKTTSAKAQGEVRAKIKTVKSVSIKPQVFMGDIDISACNKPVTGDTIVMPEVVIASVTKSETKGEASSDITSILQGKMGGPVIAVVKKEPSLMDRDLSKPSVNSFATVLTGSVGMVSINQKMEDTISGIVVDENGDPLPGASVRIKGSRRGVVADNNGKFHIEAQTGNTLLVGGVGIEPTKAIVGENNFVTIKVNRIVLVGGEIDAFIYNKKEEKNIVSGIVVDEKGDPLPGATIRVQGKGKKMVADNDGKFELKARKGDVLNVSGAGFITTKYVIKRVKENSIIVNRTVISGIEVVVGGVFYRVNPKKEIKNVPLLKQTFNDTAFSSFKVFPNPVSAGSSITIEAKKQEEGYYNFELLDQSGQTVYQQKLWIDAEARSLSVDVPNIPSGSYFLVLINNKTGKKFTEKIIVQ